MSHTKVEADERVARERSVLPTRINDAQGRRDWSKSFGDLVKAIIDRLADNRLRMYGVSNEMQPNIGARNPLLQEQRGRPSLSERYPLRLSDQESSRLV